MADPVTLAIIGGSLAAGGQVVGGIAGKNSADEQARALRLEAQSVDQQTAQAEIAQRRQARQVLARQRAALGQLGVQGDTGTFRQVAVQSAIDAELDALNIRYGGQLRSGALRNQARQVKHGGRVGLATGLLTAGGTAAAAGAQASAYKDSLGTPTLQEFDLSKLPKRR